MRLFRAGRIVVDTSLHLGEMTMEEATTFMAERCGFPVPTAHREVLRYCSYPTQASAYLTGALEIERMASEWTESGKGTLAAFHDALTRVGQAPARRGRPGHRPGGLNGPGAGGPDPAELPGEVTECSHWPGTVRAPG